jgi:sorting nexin-1/2
MDNSQQKTNLTWHNVHSHYIKKIYLFQTNYPAFKSQEFSTTRRFSDFLNLYEKLKEKHMVAGRILPPAPEKDMIGMAKVKMSKEDTTPIDFIGKRRAALERFLNRLGKNKTFRFDPDFRDFIEISEELPKATNTSALSGAGMVKMFRNLTESVSKQTKMEESDSWFDEKSRQVDNLYQQFSKLHSTIEIMYSWRKDLSSSTKEFSKSAAILANSEEQLNLSRALSQLGEIYEKIDVIYSDQANKDYFIFGELVKDYVGLFEGIREVLQQRIKIFWNWKKAEDTLRLKKEAKAKLEAANKQDKVPAAAAEIRDVKRFC